MDAALWANWPAGGRYSAEGIGYSEPATGMTLFFDSLLNYLPLLSSRPRILIPHGLTKSAVAALHQQGFVTIADLTNSDPCPLLAKQQNCDYFWSSQEKAIIPLEPRPNQPEQNRKKP